MVGHQFSVTVWNLSDLLLDPSVQSLQLLHISISVAFIVACCLRIKRAQRALGLLDPDDHVGYTEPDMGICIAVLVMLCLILVFLGQGEDLDAF
jgi:hypothetical protein